MSGPPTTLGLTGDEWQSIALTAELAGLTTLILLALAAPLAWWLTRTGSRWSSAVSALVSLPLVLPPTVIGFYLLLALGPQGAVGGTLERLGLYHLAFSFTGILIGSIIYSLPFAVQPLREAFAAIDPRVLDAAATLRASACDRLCAPVYGSIFQVPRSTLQSCVPALKVTSDRSRPSASLRESQPFLVQPLKSPAASDHACPNLSRL